MMDLKSGYPYWLVKNGLIASYPTLKEDVRCDVAVVGGGITGALVAYHMVEAGIDVVVLDRRDVGNGSTSASTALLQYEIDTPLADLIDMVGEADAVRAYQICRDAIGAIERLVDRLGDSCDFVRRTSLYLASRRRDLPALRREYELRHANGLSVDWLDAKDIAARRPFRRPAALLSHDAAEIDAYKLCHRLLAAAHARGLRIFDRTEVAHSEAGEHGIVLTTDRGCRVSARKVVYATGYEVQEQLKQRVTSLKSTYAAVSKPVEVFTGWEDRCLIWETARPYLYLRTTTDGRAIVGGEDEDFRDPARRDRLLPKKTERLRKRFTELFPKIDFEVAYAWAGTFGETKDGLAYIGETPEAPQAYFALGFGGNGITYSIVAAEMLRDAFLGRPSPDMRIFRFDR